MDSKFYRDPTTGKMLPERRTGIPRRSPRSFLSIFTSPHRRRKSRGRRKSDMGAYVDIYDCRSWLVAITILLLSALDAILTVLHLSRGSAREVNPIMNAVMEMGGLPAFFGVKAALTCVPVAIIFVHKEWGLGRFAARLCLWAYILLTVYHMYLIYRTADYSG